MSLNHVSKYTKIIIDESDQSINTLTKKELTVEEWYDMLHHTHQEFTNGTIDGTPLTDENATQIINRLEEISTTIQTLSNDINSMKDSITEINAYIEQDIQIDNNASNEP